MEERRDVASADWCGVFVGKGGAGSSAPEPRHPTQGQERRAGARKPVETASAVISCIVKAQLARASGAMDNASDYGSEDSRFPDTRPEKAQNVCGSREP